MENKNYSNGGCLTCEFAHRDGKGRYLNPCSGYANCSYEEYTETTEPTEEEKDQQLKALKEQWEKLKEFIRGMYAKAEIGGIEECVTNYILKQIKELEKESEDEE